MSLDDVTAPACRFCRCGLYADELGHQPCRLTLDALGLRCPNCQTQHGHADLLDLPLAERSVA
ncbi:MULTISPECIES: hypothetical protein [unclassified Streptomyces]|uniref:hypothetical protein n=1 Tax=unclassified Streptomyces TaxID=2593676 RepID=UPI002DDC83B3|nr:hypothetical protein [Streptomyces sp. NBC_01445]WSE02211.1 hypothetical protein OG574_01535 [Streptomyces sp. NBC_01445]